MAVVYHSIVIVPLDIETVWELVTDPKNFSGLKLPGAYSVFDSDNAREGVVFKSRGIAYQNSYLECHIIEWNSNKVFSFGYSKSNWTYRFELKEVPEGVEITYSRRFDKPKAPDNSGLPTKIIILLDGIFYHKKESQYYTDQTAKAIKDACDNYERTGSFNIPITYLDSEDEFRCE